MAALMRFATSVPIGRSGRLDQEVADVLRHRSLNTSMIYAARPWCLAASRAVAGAQ